MAHSSCRKLSMYQQSASKGHSYVERLRLCFISCTAWVKLAGNSKASSPAATAAAPFQAVTCKVANIIAFVAPAKYKAHTAAP